MPRPVFHITAKVYQGDRALSFEEGKRLIGWEVTESVGKFRDPDKQWVILTNNSTNRPFRIGLMKRYLLEMLRTKWALNGESIIFDADGKCQSGQHRLVAFIMAVLLWRKDKKKWMKYWKKEPTLECLVVSGISPAPEVVNTIDQGQKRTLGDIIFRSELFGAGVSLGEGKETISLPDDFGEKHQKRLSNILAGAARLVWLRVTDRNVSDAPHFPPSEAMDFVEQHPGLLYAVALLWDLEGTEEKITTYISLGYAAGLFYLMAASGTDPDEWVASGTEALDFSMQKQAKEFWEKIAKGTELKEDDPRYVVREMLKKMDAGSAIGRDEIVATVVNAFNAFVDRKKVKTKDLTIRRKEDEKGQEQLVSIPRLGGIDIEGQEKPTSEDEIDAQEEEDNREGDRAVKGKWSEGDTAWVKDTHDGEHWFGTIHSVYKTVDGVEVSIEGDDGKVYQEPVKRLSLKYPG